MSNEKTTERFAMTPEMAAAHWSKLYVEDKEFRAEFDENPRAALSKLMGEEMPDDIEIVVHHKKPGQIHVVLPEEIREDAPELTDDQLKQASAATGCYRSAPTGEHAGWARYRPVYDRQGRPW